MVYLEKGWEAIEMSKKMIWLTMFAAGCWMVGEGLRMVSMAIFYHDQGWYYFPGTFDLFFDWLPLVVLGGMLLHVTVAQFYHSISLIRNKSQRYRLL